MNLTNTSAEVAEGVGWLLNILFYHLKRENDAISFTEEQSAPNEIVFDDIVFFLGTLLKKQSDVISKGTVHGKRWSGKAVNSEYFWGSFSFFAGFKSSYRHWRENANTQREREKKKRSYVPFLLCVGLGRWGNLKSYLTDLSFRRREILSVAF